VPASLVLALAPARLVLALALALAPLVLALAPASLVLALALAPVPAPEPAPEPAAAPPSAPERPAAPGVRWGPYFQAIPGIQVCQGDRLAVFLPGGPAGGPGGPAGGPGGPADVTNLMASIAISLAQPLPFVATNSTTGFEPVSGTLPSSQLFPRSFFSFMNTCFPSTTTSRRPRLLPHM